MNLKGIPSNVRSVVHFGVQDIGRHHEASRKNSGTDPTRSLFAAGNCEKRLAHRFCTVAAQGSINISEMPKSRPTTIVHC